MPTDARKLSEWLQHQPDSLQLALSNSERMVQVNRAFRDWLREPWADSVRIATCDGETTVVFAAHAAAAALLRFHSPAILAFVRERYNPACTEVQIKVQPDTYTAI